VHSVELDSVRVLLLSMAPTSATACVSSFCVSRRARPPSAYHAHTLSAHHAHSRILRVLRNGWMDGFRNGRRNGWAVGWVDGMGLGVGGGMGLRVGFININDMYNNDVCKGVVYAYEAYEAK